MSLSLEGNVTQEKNPLMAEGIKGNEGTSKAAGKEDQDALQPRSYWV